MQNLLSKLKNLKHPAAIAALLFSLALPAAIAWAGNVNLGGSDLKELIGRLDLNLPFWLFATQTVLGILLLLDLGKDLFSFAKTLNPGKNWIIAVVAFTLVATLATGFWIEGRHRVQSDESIFLSTAQNLYSLQVAGACDEGQFQDGKLDCTKSANNFKARGLAFVYTLGMPILGHDLQWIFAFHLVLYFLTGLLFFFALFAWLGNAPLSFLSMVILLVQPTVMFQFRSSSVEPLYVFLSALALFQMKWAFERDTVRHWVLLALTLAFFAQTRQETAFCLGAFVFFSLPKLLSAKDMRFPAFISTLALFAIPVLLTISYHQGYDFQGGEFEAHGNFWKDVSTNWDVMANTALSPDGLLVNPFLTSSTYLGLFGLITLVIMAFFNKKARIGLGFLALYHIQTYMILENVSGDFTIEINQRYSLVFMPTLAFLGALFLYMVFFRGLPKMLGAKPLENSGKSALLTSVIVGLVLVGMTFQYKQSFQENIMYNRNHLVTEEHTILEWVRTLDTKPRLFVYARPWHFIGYGYSSIHYDKIRSMGTGELTALIEKYQGEVYYVRGLDCWDRQTWHKKAVEHRIASTCDDFERKFEVQPLFQTMITNNYELSIGRIKGPKDYDLASLITLGVFQYLEKPDFALISYKLDRASVHKWSYRIWINDSLMADKPYEPKETLDTLRHPKMVPGYNVAKLAIFDSTGTELSVRETSLFSPQGNAEPLTRLKPTQAIQGWGNLQQNLSVNGNPLRVAGHAYAEGLGTHASSQITFQLDGEYNRITALVGQDDEELGGDGMLFRVNGDGKTLWTSTTVQGNQMQKLDISLKGVKTLVLEVDSLGDKSFDHADWIFPTLYKSQKP